MRHLLAISVGPVQDFIAAARRTRDLWFGSQLLSDISRAVAKELAKHGELIFPASIQEENVANILLVELTENVDPRMAADASKKIAQQAWQKEAISVHEQLAGELRTDIWKEQVDDVIEVYAVWVARSADYREDRKRLNRLMAARKNARDFNSAGKWPGIPKSSLDGQRDSVLRKETAASTKLRLSDGEQLDVVGLVKRLGGGKATYPSVARVAADPYLRGKTDAELQPLRDACKELGGDIVHRVDEKQFEHFPYEGSVVYADRIRSLMKETGTDESRFRSLRQALARLDGEPKPYLAVLVADGDNMGAALSALCSPDEHRIFSARLAKFARSVDDIVRENRGVLVYAGGDDVLAFVPVDYSLKCARDLHKKFNDITQMNLSVGIGIGHFMENLEDLLEFGRAAEKAAKAADGKNSLAVHLHKRGGAPIEIQGRWNDNLDEHVKIDEHLAEMVNLINGKMLSARVAYDLRRMADLYRDWPDPTQAIQRDVKRLLAAKKPEGGNMGTKEIEVLIDSRVVDAASLEAFAKELLVARLIAEVQRRAEGKKEDAT